MLLNRKLFTSLRKLSQSHKLRKPHCRYYTDKKTTTDEDNFDDVKTLKDLPYETLQSELNEIPTQPSFIRRSTKPKAFIQTTAQALRGGGQRVESLNRSGYQQPSTSGYSQSKFQSSASKFQKTNPYRPNASIDALPDYMKDLDTDNSSSVSRGSSYNSKTRSHTLDLIAEDQMEDPDIDSSRHFNPTSSPSSASRMQPSFSSNRMYQPPPPPPPSPPVSPDSFDSPGIEEQYYSAPREADVTDYEYSPDESKSYAPSNTTAQPQKREQSKIFHAIYKPSKREEVGSAVQFSWRTKKGGVYITAAKQRGSKNAPGSSDPQFDWENKLVMALNVTEMAEILRYIRGQQNKVNFMHKFNLYNTSGISRFSMSPGNNDTHLIQLNRQPDGDPSRSQTVSLYFDGVEATVLEQFFSAAIRKTMGFD
eukprot:TRINITY_DN9789_c0_g1_i1.p1 TRINITY_DN9789_c0_g1~~TRINITY_DN9789_c0_g1_i1.p1  ORF type:complete len:422 (+),score=85.54 TRINITY_DN9789_c0_g1_i1:30-1295(+)